MLKEIVYTKLLEVLMLEGSPCNSRRYRSSLQALARLLSTSINGRHRCMLRRSCGKLVDHQAPHVLFCQACLHWPAHPSEPGLLAVHSHETSHVSRPMTIHQLGISNSKLGAHLHGSPCLARAPLCKLGVSRCVDQANITLLWSLKGRQMYCESLRWPKRLAQTETQVNVVNLRLRKKPVSS